MNKCACECSIKIPSEIMRKKEKIIDAYLNSRMQKERYYLARSTAIEKRKELEKKSKSNFMTKIISWIKRNKLWHTK